MWQQNYLPIENSLFLSALLAAVPIFVLLTLIGIMRKPAWVAATSGLAAAMVVSILVYDMPLGLALSATTYGAAQGLFPIGWIVYWAIVMYRVTLDTGKFEIIKDSIGGLTADRRLQAMLIAFAFGAFIEGASGFGAPVAVAAAMLAGLGFSPFFAAGICLLANTAPVAFGSIGIPVVTLASITGLDELELSAWVGRLCAPISIFIPAYLIMVMGGVKALKGVIPAAAVCGLSFASVQFLVSNYIGPQLTDILAAMASILGLVALFKVWQPKDTFVMAGDTRGSLVMKKHSGAETLLAWSPYILLVVFVLVWGSSWGKAILDQVNIVVEWPGLHNQVVQSTPAVATPTPYAAIYRINWLSAAGTAAGLAGFVASLILGMKFKQYVLILGDVLKQLLRFHRDHGYGLCRHRFAVPLLQRDAGLARRIPHGFRHLGERLVRQPASGYGQPVGPGSRHDGRRQLGRWRDGQNDQPAVAGSGRGCYRHVALAGERTAALHLQAQCFPGVLPGCPVDDLRLHFLSIAALKKRTFGSVFFGLARGFSRRHISRHNHGIPYAVIFARVLPPANSIKFA
jgi:lactate permease